MRNYTVTDILKILPFDEAKRAEFITKFDSSDVNARAQMESVCWSLFTEYYEGLADIKYKELLQKATEDGHKLTHGLMDEAYEKVHEDFENVLNGKQQDTQQIQAIQEKLQSLTGN